MEYICKKTELYHHGIKGQKWGVRRYQNDDGSLTDEGRARYGSSATEYSKEQYVRDKRVYGTIAANRINKGTLRGEQISGLRSKEADRINSFRNAASAAGQTGKIVGAIAGGVASAAVMRRLKNMGKLRVNAVTEAAIIAGSSVVGGILLKEGAKSTTKIVGGYSPFKR